MRDTLQRQGSSPLTRGARGLRVRRWPAVRLIPAHAGSTFRCGVEARPVRAHPRSRGEHRRPRRHDRRVLRLIPAHAGSTAILKPITVDTRAHPRSRGEHDRGTFQCGESSGSSPLTRGAPVVDTMAHRRRRLIPAHAGSTVRAGHNLSSLWAHPRSRGEHG